MARRAIAYVDGFNLYYGLRSLQRPEFKWLNVQRLVQELLFCQYYHDASLVHTHYFTAAIRDNPTKQKRQNTFFSALETLDDFDIHFGTYRPHDQTCPNCGHNYQVYREKKSDVNLASQLLRDGFRGEFDIALIVSRDSDLVPPARIIKEEQLGEVFFAFPPGKRKLMTIELEDIADRTQRIREWLFEKCRFDRQITTRSGVTLTCPREWQGK